MPLTLAILNRNIKQSGLVICFGMESHRKTTKIVVYGAFHRNICIEKMGHLVRTYWLFYKSSVT